MVKELKLRDLTLCLDTEYLSRQKKTLPDYISDEICDEDTCKKEIDRLVEIAEDIIDGNLGKYGVTDPKATIFDYLPLTKEGNFHKSKHILLASSNISESRTSDTFSLETVQLRIVPCETGKTADIKLDWFSFKDEKPLIAKDNSLKKAEKKERNSYIKEGDLKAGCSYVDAKGREFLYLGHYYLRTTSGTYTSEAEYLKSDDYKYFYDRMVNDEWYNGYYIYIPVTKKTEGLISSCSDLDEFFDIFLPESDKISHKYLENPMKVVSKSRDLLSGTLTKKFYRDRSYKNYFHYVVPA